MQMEPGHLPPNRKLQHHNPIQQSTRRPIQAQNVGSSPMTMHIPNRRSIEAPPPLPPPRYVNDVPPEDEEPYAPRGFGGFPKTWSHREDGRRPRRLEPLQRESATVPSSWSRSPTDSDRRYHEEMRIQQDEGYYSLSGPSISQLPGEKQLHHQHQERSSQSYDRNLLGKLGKPVDSPSRQPAFGSFGSAESSPTVQFSRQNTLRSLSFPNTNASLLSDPPIKQEPGRFADSPRVSPRTSKAFVPEFRSPIFDPHSKPSSRDSDTIPQASQRFPTSINIERQQKSRRSESSGCGLPRVDESAAGFIPNPVKREFSEQHQPSIFSSAEQDSTIRMTEKVRHLHLNETTPTEFRFPEFQRCSMSNPTGTKRKLSQEDNAVTLTQQAVVKAAEYFRSPQHLTTQYGQHHDSISSQSSGYRHDSYASSTGADGSYTSVEHTSPGVSPTTEGYQQYVTQSYDTKPRKQGSPPFHCTCCSKKPKKFQTAEELQQHQNEKQFHCMYCANKFKNKNEMERHQNSIHRRTNSWCCAELEKFEDAFFPSTAFGATGGQFQPQTNGASPTDLCGYCGEEFSNEPRDLEARHHHLTATHKFGECNRGKKFWRADHFRQHLKHSHSGKNGKHTNALEQKCAREGPPQQLSETAQQAGPGTTPTPGNPGAPVANMRPPGQEPEQPSQQQSVMPPPPQTIPMDMANIDPTMNMITTQAGGGGPPPQQQQPQPSPPQGLQQIQRGGGPGSGSGGFEYKSSAAAAE